MRGDGIPYGGGLSMEQRIARVEQVVIAKSIGTTEGDLIGFDDNGLPIRIPAAAGNGYSLSSDTSQTGGVAWQATDNFQRRLLYQAHGFKFGSAGAGTTYILGSDSSTSVASPLSSATTLYTVPILRLDDADYAVAGKTLKLALDCSINMNDTAPGVNITFALLPIASIAGAANALSFSYGSALASTVFTTPTASQHAFGSTMIDFPADGPHVIGVAFSNNQAANSMVSFTGRVYVTWV